MSNRVRLRYGAATDVGLVRDRNEDAYLAEPPVFVVADGMGGHHGGDIASGLVVEEFGRLSPAGLDASRAAAEVTATLKAVQRRIEEYAVRRGGGRDGWYSGTTVVVAIVVEVGEDASWLLANLGDSRVYRFAGDVLEQVSVDHSVVQELIEAGSITEAEAATHPERHVITRALGGPEPPAPDFFELPLAAAPRLLLCSDGVSGLLADHDIGRILAAADDPRDAADGLVAAALAAGGTDNATAVVVEVVGWPTLGAPPSPREPT